MDELIFIFILLITSGSIITIYHLYEKKGIKILLIMMTILYLIMSFKTTNIFGLKANLNIIPTTSIYTLIIILLEKHSKKDIQENMKLIIATITFTSIIYILFILFTESINDNIILNTNHLLEYIPNIVSLCTIPVFITLLIRLYKYIKENNKNFYINTIICTVLLIIIETFITTIIVYMLHFNIKLVAQIILSNYLLKILIILLNLSIIKLITSQRKWLS